VTELIPTKATFAPGDPLEVEVRGDPAPVSLWRLDTRIAEAAPEDGLVRFPPQPEGGYGLEGGGATGALDVLADPLSRPRYGFVARYERGRDTEGMIDNVRRLHLNAVQFYDWMYRHAQLVSPTEEFEDALGQRISLDTVRRLATALTAAGSSPLAYAAVYAAGRDEWPAWEDAGLFRADGSAWTLGEDFLWNVDPSNERWLSHFAGELRSALAAGGFAGFHLDQYGAPKHAVRRDGTTVDLAEAFPALLEHLAVEIPEARMIFNNVNDFPTWATARATQDAVYIEVWAPHVRLAHLAELVTKARSLAPERGIILAAYLSAFRGDEAAAAAAERLQHSVVFSHGGSVLLHGEADAVLTEAYYVSNQSISPEAQESARRCYDFAVRYGDLFFDRSSVDVTRSYLGGVNEDITVVSNARVSTDCEAGALWVRVIRTSEGLLISLIDLSQQDDDLWDAPKRPAPPLRDVSVGLERTGSRAPRIDFAEPDETPGLTPLVPEFDGRHDRVVLPPFGPWAIVLVRDEAP
jgi:dextranase